MPILISIIIPCYNSGLFLKEAIESVFQNNCKDFEIIVVNDGSTDIETLDFLNSINSINSQIRVFNKDNGGPSSARNLGMAYAKGEYFLFLDSDNMIAVDYINKALEVLLSKPNIDILYANPIFIGDISKNRYDVKPFNFENLLLGNYIDMCSFVKKNLFNKLGGFDESRLIIGWEDWEFWIRASISGAKFYHLNEELYYYRIRGNSLSDHEGTDRLKIARDYICFKHGTTYREYFKKYYKLNAKMTKNPLWGFFYIIRASLFTLERGLKRKD